MARPIKETPVVYGKNAVRILKEMENPKPLSMERIEEIRRSHEMFKQNYKASYEEAGLKFERKT